MVEIKNEALSKAIKDSMVYGKGEVLIIDPKEVLKLQSQNTELKALVKELVEACEFYSEIGHWGVGDSRDNISIDPSDQYELLGSAFSADTRGGKRAREVLSRNKEFIEAIKGE